MVVLHCVSGITLPPDDANSFFHCTLGLVSGCEEEIPASIDYVAVGIGDRDAIVGWSGRLAAPDLALVAMFWFHSVPIGDMGLSRCAFVPAHSARSFPILALDGGWHFW